MFQLIGRSPCSGIGIWYRRASSSSEVVRLYRPHIGLILSQIFRPIQCFPQSLKSVRIIAFAFFLYRNVFLGCIWNSVSIPNRYALCGSSRFFVFGLGSSRRCCTGERDASNLRRSLPILAKLGFISFGGPTGQIAVMDAELVEKKKWISEARFLHALNSCMLLPGPEALQLGYFRL